MKLTEREKAIYQVTWAGSFVNFLLVIFKFIAGILGHSAAMIADAVRRDAPRSLRLSVW